MPTADVTTLKSVLIASTTTSVIYQKIACQRVSHAISSVALPIISAGVIAMRPGKGGGEIALGQARGTPGEFV